MAKKPKTLTRSQLDELKACLLRLGIDRNKSAPLLAPSRQYESYQEFVKRGDIKPQASAPPSVPVNGLPVAPQESAPPSAPAMPADTVAKIAEAFQRGLEAGKRPGRGPGRKPKRVRYSLLLDAEVLDAYNKLSADEERPVSELMRLALRRAIQPASAGQSTLGAS